jgi:hypothetical protein
MMVGFIIIMVVSSNDIVIIEGAEWTEAVPDKDHQRTIVTMTVF